MMQEKTRKTGIDIMGDVSWGTHFCLFYQTKEDLTDILVPYFKAGLENNEFCMWITSESLSVEDAKKALQGPIKDLDDYMERRQIEILDYSQWYTKSGKFEADGVLKGWVEKEAQAVENGFDGLRLTGNTFWLKKKNWREFADYEATVDGVIGKYRMLAICTYSLDRCGIFEVIDVIRNHKFAFINREGKWEIIESPERKRAEETFRESEERYRTILESIEEGYFEVDIAGNFTLFNDSLCKILGYPRDDMMGMNNRQYMDQDNAKKVYQVFNQVYKTGKPCKFFDWENVRKDGTKIFLESSVSLIKDTKGKPIGFRGIVRDITERKRAEEELRASEQKYRTLIENLPQRIFLKDIHSVYVSCNENYAHDLKIKPYEIVGKTDYDFYPKELAEKYRADDKRIIASERTEDLEERYIRNGQEICVHIVKTPVRDEEGKTKGILGIFWDITEQKKAEEKLVSLEQQLRQSQKMEAVGRLSGGIAHDFNNLLTVIKGYTQLSSVELKEKESDHLKGNLEEIKKATERAANLIRHLLAFSRRQIMEMRVLDLNALLKNLDKMLRRIIGEDIELVNLLAEDLGRVKTDPGQIEQVIMNLAVNARDAMPSGGKLTIETADVELDEEYARAHVAVTPGGYVMLSVSDTGVGMTPEVRERVFEPFYTTKESGKGTGLGLSTVYGIVKQSGGNIWVYSEPGKGTTFKIYLPRVDEPLEEEEKKIVVKEEIPRGNETVLLVEDDEKVRRLAVQILQRQGYRVLESPQGVDAFLISAEHDSPIHLLLTDVVMPKMSGCELADRIASIHPEIKVLYMSGYTDNAIIHHEVLKKGMNFIQKPFTIDGLASKVREVLDKS